MATRYSYNTDHMYCTLTVDVVDKHCEAQCVCMHKLSAFNATLHYIILLHIGWHESAFYPDYTPKVRHNRTFGVR